MFSFANNKPFRIESIANGDLQYVAQFLSVNQADLWFNGLISQVPWRQAEIRIFGKKVLTPRLTCWMGDAGAIYRYSNTSFAPEPWIEPVLAAKHAIEAFVPHTFNSVLLNYYRNGNDAMGWHSDDEPELGLQPVIASLSLGAERRFLFREKHKGARSIGLPLERGSLLLMQGDSQKKYQHALPRTSKPIGARINLTFRKIV